MNSRTRYVLAMILCLAGSSQADDILIDDSFEGTLGNWTVTNGAGLYTWPGSGSNYAAVGTGAAQIPRSCGDPALLLKDPLLLQTQLYTNVTWSFDWNTPTGGGTVRFNFQYTDDGGTNWTTLAQVTASSSAPMQYSKTLDIGTYNFTDNALFRIVGGCQTPSHMLYADEMLIIGSPTPPPKGTVVSLF